MTHDNHITDKPETTHHDAPKIPDRIQHLIQELRNARALNLSGIIHQWTEHAKADLHSVEDRISKLGEGLREKFIHKSSDHPHLTETPHADPLTPPGVADAQSKIKNAASRIHS